MGTALRFVFAVIALLVSAMGVMLVVWPGWLHTLRNGGGILPTGSGDWQLFTLNSQGQGLPFLHVPFIIACLIMLPVLCIATTNIDLLTGTAQRDWLMRTKGSSWTSAMDERLNGELTAITRHLLSHAEANGTFSQALTKARDQLPDYQTPEQVRVIVSFLMVENEAMRRKSAELQQNLERSQQQIARLRSNLAEAEAQGVSDPLTSVRNRRGFDLCLSSEIADAKSTGSPLSLILADIDHFKLVNDRYGHPAGDEVLRAFSRVLSKNVKGRDTVARYGGEEFAIILPRTILDGANRIADQIRDQVAARNWAIGQDRPPVKITASFGVAQLAEGEGTDALLRRTDSKLYEAKASGRNKVSA